MNRSDDPSEIPEIQLNYVENKTSASDKSLVWLHFLQARDANSGKCKICKTKY